MEDETETEGSEDGLNRYHEGLSKMAEEFRDEVMLELIEAAKKGAMSLREFDAFCDSVGICEAAVWLRSGRPSLDHLPEKFRHAARHCARDAYTAEVSWAVYTTEYIDSLTKLLEGKRVLEVCAGRGILQPIMRKRGIEWISTDENPPAGAEHVEGMNAHDALDNYRNMDAIFASWIPLGARWDVLLLDRPPLVLVGEGPYGCTGSDQFWDLVDELKLETYEPAERYHEWFEDIPKWEGVHDYTLVIGELEP